MSGKLNLGCPVWACEHWRGSLFRKRAARRDWLRQYSTVFNTVEGNSTFYGLPRLETAQDWVDYSRPEFRFCLKTPRVITHDLRLQNAAAETAKFVEVLDVLDVGRRIGPTFIQLPPDFSPSSFSVLESWLRDLPTYLPWAVEVRHHDWYDNGTVESELDAMLRELRMDKVLFDSRPLYSKPPSDEVERVSQSRKPKTPIRRTVTSEHPFLRIVGRNQLDDVQPWIDEWAPVIAAWLESGKSPFIFAHAPDDRFAPEFARRIHAAVRKYVSSLPNLPDWPGEKEEADTFVQKTLF